MNKKIPNCRYMWWDNPKYGGYFIRCTHRNKEDIFCDVESCDLVDKCPNCGAIESLEHKETFDHTEQLEKYGYFDGSVVKTEHCFCRNCANVCVREHILKMEDF